MIDPTRQLTEHFTLGEMTRSSTAVRRGIPNVPSADNVAALTLLCARVLEPVRAHFGRPVRVTSGYRAPRVNVSVGGSATSQHCLGEAADFTVLGVPNIEVCRWIAEHLAFDQLIYEFGEAGWVHCSFSAHRARGDVRSARKRGGKTVYLPGLVA